jgi:hypothetical protein
MSTGKETERQSTAGPDSGVASALAVDGGAEYAHAAQNESHRTAKTQNRLAAVPWMLAAVVLGVPIVAFGFAWRSGVADTNFWLALLANVLATLFGIIGGIPIALAISGWQQAAVGRANQALKQQQADGLEQRVTRVLVEEFRQNQELARDWRKALETQEPIADGFYTERWQVLKQSGELAGVRDLELVSAFARCHELYRTFNRILEHLLRIVWFVGIDHQWQGRQSGRAGRTAEAIATMLSVLNAIDGMHGALAKRLPPAAAAQ